MFCNTAQNNLDFMEICANKLTTNVFLISIRIIRRAAGKWPNTIEVRDTQKHVRCDVLLNE